MKPYLVSFDLMKEGQQYAALNERLRALGAVKLLYSQWVVLSGQTALDLTKDLLRFVDGNDRLLVNVLVPSQTAFYGLLVPNEQFQHILAA